LKSHRHQRYACQGISCTANLLEAEEQNGPGQSDCCRSNTIRVQVRFSRNLQKQELKFS